VSGLDIRVPPSAYPRRSKWIETGSILHDTERITIAFRAVYFHAVNFRTVYFRSEDKVLQRSGIVSLVSKSRSSASWMTS